MTVAASSVERISTKFRPLPADLTVAIWRGNKVYFMFDGMNRGPNGVVSLNGTACITRYLDLQEMSKVFLANLSHYGRNTFSIHRVTMTRDVCPRAREPKELKENPRKRGVSGTGGFQAVVAGERSASKPRIPSHVIDRIRFQGNVSYAAP